MIHVLTAVIGGGGGGGGVVAVSKIVASSSVPVSIPFAQSVLVIVHPHF